MLIFHSTPPNWKWAVSGVLQSLCRTPAPCASSVTSLGPPVPPLLPFLPRGTVRNVAPSIVRRAGSDPRRKLSIPFSFPSCRAFGEDCPVSILIIMPYTSLVLCSRGTELTPHSRIEPKSHPFARETALPTWSRAFLTAPFKTSCRRPPPSYQFPWKYISCLIIFPFSSERV